MKQTIFCIFLSFSSSLPILAYAEGKTSENKSASIAHPLGSCYGGGIIFYLNTTPNAPAGQRGLIVALSDASTGCNSPTGTCVWDITGFTAKLIAPHRDYFSGAENTKEILKALGESRAQAAYAASQYKGGGYSDWYLPAQKELSELYTQVSSTGENFWTGCGGSVPSAGSYWSSTQLNTRVAWGIAFANGNVPYGVTTSSLGVRAIRAF